MRRPGDSGYTVVEVTMALAILAVGASGILALQKVTLAGVTNGRNVATANEIAVAWTERLRADASAWNNPVTGSDLTDTTWLDQATDPPGVWIVPASVAPNGSAWADIEGNDIYPGVGGDGAYCTHIRLTRQYGSLIRAEVRVFWKRNGTPAVCDDPPVDITGDVATYGFVQIVTGVFNTVNPT